jgi:hypothetical protein
MSKRKLDPYTLMAMYRRLWRHGVAQRKLGALQYAQGIFSAASRCRDEARSLESATRKKATK